jgi:hypothetical protein
MSEDEARRDSEESQDEVEAHKRSKVAANEEAGDEAAADDEVEAHRYGKKMV